MWCLLMLAVDAQMMTVDARVREKSTRALPDRAFGFQFSLLFFNSCLRLSFDLAQTDQTN